MVEHPLSKRKVRSSILRGGRFFFFHSFFCTFVISPTCYQEMIVATLYNTTSPAYISYYHTGTMLLHIPGHDILKSISELYYCAVAYFEMHSICGKGITDIYLLSSTNDHGRHSAPISVHTWNVGVFKIEQWFGKKYLSDFWRPWNTILKELYRHRRHS